MEVLSTSGSELGSTVVRDADRDADADSGRGLRPTLERVLFAGGGTGGHVYMAVAIRDELKDRRPATQCLFVGTERGLEARILPPLGFPLRTIRISGIKNKGMWAALKALLQIPASLLQSRRIIREFKPAAVVGLGGYSSGPVVAAARLSGCPAVVIEPNVVPGLTNRLLARWIDGAAYAFAETGEHFPGGGRLTGIPIRSEFHRIFSQVSSQGPLRVLVFGGSLGSRPINDLLCGALAELDDSQFKIVHQTGPADCARVRELYREKGFEAEVCEYIDDMPSRFADCDLVVSRAGASTIAEITAAGRAAILVPFPGAADDHQRRNAEALEKIGAAVVLDQAEAGGSDLARWLRRLDKDRDRLRDMAHASRSLAQPDSAARIVDLLEETASRN